MTEEDENWDSLSHEVVSLSSYPVTFDGSLNAGPFQRRLKAAFSACWEFTWIQDPFMSVAAGGEESTTLEMCLRLPSYLLRCIANTYLLAKATIWCSRPFVAQGVR